MKAKIEKIFLLTIIPIGLLYIIFMLPTYAPDESAHIWRAYDISQGNIFTRQNRKTGEAIGINIPQILIDAKQENLNNYDKLKELLIKKTNYNDTSICILFTCCNFIFYS